MVITVIGIAGFILFSVGWAVFWYGMGSRDEARYNLERIRNEKKH